MGKTQFCRICRTEKDLKFTTKQLREFNKGQLHIGSDKGSQKLLRTTPTLGNICRACNDRVKIFHCLDDPNPSSDSDIEIDVVNVSNIPLQSAKVLADRPDTPIIVDDDDMLYDTFMQKVSQQQQQTALLPPPTIQLPHVESSSQPQQFISHFNPIITPPRSIVGSEGDDAKVIEILNSGENTPVPIDRNDTTVPSSIESHPAINIVDEKGHRIIAVIDLDDDELDKSIEYNTSNKSNEANTPKCNNEPANDPTNDLLNFIVASASPKKGQQSKAPTTVSPSKNSKNETVSSTTIDDDDVLFCPTENTSQSSSPSKKKMRKSYDDKEMRLIASLSLVSSDSESEDSTNITSPQKTITVSPQRFSCTHCKKVFPDKDSLLVHEQIHKGIKCPVCRFGYAQEQRLIHHMRYKHRTYSGIELTENPRAAQDSAMTIRLRFMQRKTFYECQLCGRIDEVFKEHKEHIINKHPVESKKLKDPIMNELKCPLCKCKCGPQYITLCRHIITNHKYNQYKTHLREIVHISAFGLNGTNQQEILKSARVFQFNKKKAYFFQCKLCHKITAGYKNHLKHNTDRSCGPKTNTSPVKKANVKSNKDTNVAQKINSTKTLKSVPNADHCNEIVSKSNTSPTTRSLMKKGPESTKSENKQDVKIAQVLNSTKNLRKVRNKIIQEDSKSFKKINSSKPIKLKTIKCTATNDKKKPKVSSPKSKQTVKKKEILRKPKTIPIMIPTSQDKKKQSKKKQLELQLKKIKVKPAPIKLINLQYKCKFCAKEFKGFLLYNLHLLNEHKNDEYQECSKCRKKFLTVTRLHKHNEYCAMDIKNQRRRFVKDLLPTDANCNSAIHNNTQINSVSVDCTAEDNSSKFVKPTVPCERKKRSENNRILPALKNADTNPR